MRLLQPQEVEVYYLLPAIRKALALAMVETKNQKEIAELLGVTPAAVSQYLHDKRGSTVFPKEFAKIAKEASSRITDTESMIRETQALLAWAKDEKLICRIHALHADIPKHCEVCYE